MNIRNILGEEFRTLWILFLPLATSSFCNSLFTFLEKVFLSRVSHEALETAMNTAYVTQIFEIAPVALVMMGQIGAARRYGANEYSLIGPKIWQFIWFSILSSLITIPASICYGLWYFHGTEIETIALPYFYTQVLLNLFNPLAVSISCFFLGIGDSKTILYINLGDQVIKVSLAYILIFGINSWIQPLGLLGGIIANLVAQAGLCIVLLALFLRKKFREKYKTNNWKFVPHLFWENIKPGLFRALNRIITFTNWAAIAHLMTEKGGSYIFVLSIGGSLSLILPCVFEGLFQSLTTIVSQRLGAKSVNLLSKITQSSTLLVSIAGIALAIPCFIFPQDSFELLFPNTGLALHEIQSILLGIWLWFIYFTFAAIPLSFILAFKDTKFYFYIGAIFWMTDYAFMYLFIEIINIKAQNFWTVLALVQIFTTMPAYILRMIYLKMTYNSKTIPKLA